MGTQFIESLDDLAFDRSAFGQPCHDEGKFFARWDRNCRARGPSDAPRTPQVAINWLLIQFFERQNVEVGQKSTMLRGKQTSSDLAAPEPAFLYKSFRPFTGARRGSPILNVGLGGKESRRGTLGYMCEIVENAGPKLWHEGAFVDTIDEFWVHGLLVRP